MDKVAASLLGVAVGWCLARFSARLDRRRKYRDDFAAEIESVRRELANRSDNVDLEFVKWHYGSVSRLRVHSDYLRLAESAWWNKRVQKVWADYELADVPPNVDAFGARRVNRKMMLEPLANLVHAVRKTGWWPWDS